LADSLAAYRAGDLLGALQLYPDNRQPASDPERIYRAATLLAAGQVDQSLAALNPIQGASPLADALREMIAAVKNQPFASPSPLNGERAGLPAKGSATAGVRGQATASESIAHSYYLQSRSFLEGALAS